MVSRRRKLDEWRCTNGKRIVRTAYITHTACQRHDTGPALPECANRQYAIEDQFISTGLRDVLRYIDAPEVTAEQLLRVHTVEHVETVSAMIPDSGHARLDPDTVVSPDSLVAAYRAAGAAVAAVDLVVAGEMDSAFCAVRPPGHHAESNRAMGFCLFNNVAVGAAHALEVHGIGKLAILDFDVHQGNGTASIFAGEPGVFTLSMHQERNYPHPKPPGDLDIGLSDGTGDETYLALLADALDQTLEVQRPELAVYLAGADPFAEDQLGGLALTLEGLEARDRMVLDECRSRGVAVAVVLAGGYARREQDTVRIHRRTAEIAREIWEGERRESDRT